MSRVRAYSWSSLRRYLHGPVGWLIVLNVIVYGFLLARIIASLLFGSPASALLLNGLNGQISRLEIIAEGPCDSAGMQQFKRGEIGPIPDLPAGPGAASLPPAASGSASTLPGTPDANSNTPQIAPAPAPAPAAPAAPAAETEPAPAPPGPPGRMLNADNLRTLVNQSVVRILTDQGTGSGFAITPTIIVTNRHVIEDAASGSISVTSKFLGAEPVPAKLLASSPDSQTGNPDFAVLELQGGKPLVPLSIGNDPKPLDNVVAAGFPGITITSDSNDVSPEVVFSQGEVSVVQAQPNGVGLVIHTANIAPGSSGGPLINRCGTLVGVNTFVRMGEQAEGRALYSLSPVALSKYLASAAIAFRPTTSDCAPGGG